MSTGGWTAPTACTCPPTAAALRSYNSLGQRTKLNRGGGNVVTNYTPDGLGRLTTFKNDLPSTANDVTWTFSYSPAGQVTSWGADSTNYDYVEPATSTVNQTYDGLNRDTSIVTASGYDLRGNIIKDATRATTYDEFNRFLSAAPVGTPGTHNTDLVYDPEGRLAKYSPDGTSSWISFVYDGTNVIAEYNGTTTTVLRQYVFGPGTDEPVVWYEGSGFTGRHYLVANYQGSIVATTDGSGNLENTYEYGAYGEPQINRSSTTNPWTGTALRFRYTGQMVLPNAQLYYYKARVYDPIYGHFLQTDPIGTKDDLDLYAYTHDDPIDGTDPSGNAFICIPCLVGAVQNYIANSAPGVTFMITEGLQGQTAAGVGGHGSTEGGLAVDSSGTAKPVVTGSIGPVAGGDVGLGPIISVTLANGKVDDQRGASLGGGGQIGPFSGSVAHGTNTEGKNVTSFSLHVSTSAGLSVSGDVNYTHVVPQELHDNSEELAKKMDEVDRRAAENGYHCRYGNCA